MNAPALQTIQTNDPIFSGVTGISEDNFLRLEDLFSVKGDASDRLQKRVLREMEELIRENKWADVKALFYPIEDKVPEAIAAGVDVPIRGKLAFVLGQIQCFDEAIRELEICLKKEPDHFLYNSSMAYTAYNSLYAAKNREIVMTGKLRSERIELAHRHFKKAQKIRPDGITNFYREGMLFKQIENKPEDGVRLFEKAVNNWENLSDAEKKERHQEQKNYIKSLYEFASCLLHQEKAPKSHDMLKKCLALDEKTNYVSVMFKYFALGKVEYHLNRFTEAKDALVFALQNKNGNQAVDFVYELLAKTYIALGQPEKALESIRRVPEQKRRPYVRWTEAEALCALGKIEDAKKALVQAVERDNLSRHKTWIHLAKMEYLTRNYDKAMTYAGNACRFFQEKWRNPYGDGLFWQALSAHRLGNQTKAAELTETLKQHMPFYPKLAELMKLMPMSAV